MNADNRRASPRREKEEEGGWRVTTCTLHNKRLTPWPSRDLQYFYPLNKYKRIQKQNLMNTTPNYYVSIVKTATYSQIKMTHLWIERENEVRCETGSTPGGREREGGRDPQLHEAKNKIFHLDTPHPHLSLAAIRNGNISSLSILQSQYYITFSTSQNMHNYSTLHFFLL